ncbi:diacylglycerol kinase [Acidihalobacter ferrooxydans]|uniref:Diacylglycerol kinase n=1 Tax=Acidihalobacter ferrooxydans TaxID=1765967 RepID=A0A1P8UDG2_9GAMM|nr:diacylglycerol kinase [Acidihalobacter ferrooxydans]APZ41901.1 diacylglycerol kinase [Acidihalobacter ferrooxydans]
MGNSGNTGLKRFLMSFVYSGRGLASGFKHEEAFRQEVLGAVVMIPLAFWLGHDTVQRVLLFGSVMLVLIVELLNSAIEAAIDRVGSERHPLAAQAKDMASAAVFLSFINSMTIWGLILLPRWLS